MLEGVEDGVEDGVLEGVLEAPAATYSSAPMSQEPERVSPSMSVVNPKLTELVPTSLAPPSPEAK